MWSNVVVSQLKGARPFYFVKHLCKLMGIKMTLSFFGFGHGKGEHDGAGAVLKRCLTYEKLKSDGVVLRKAIDVVQFLKRKLSAGAASSYVQSTKEGPEVHQKFWLFLRNFAVDP